MENVEYSEKGTSEEEEVIEDLIYYVRTDDIIEIKNLLQNKNINSINDIKDENGNTLLHFACANNNIAMIKFLLYECGIDYNPHNNSGNSPLLWALQNKNYEAIQEILLFDYQLNKEEYISIEKKKNELYENMSKNVKYPLLNDTYLISEDIKKKIKALKLINNIFPCAQNGHQNGLHKKEEIHLYKKRNKINLLKKNEFQKNILSEAFNAQDENILHLVLSHPISSVLDNQEGSFTNENFRDTHSDGINNCDDGKIEGVYNMNTSDGCKKGAFVQDGSPEMNATGVSSTNGYAMGVSSTNGYAMGVSSTNGYATGVSSTNGYATGVNSTNGYATGVNSTNEYGTTVTTDSTQCHEQSCGAGSDFTANIEEAQIVQEYTHELLINEKIKMNNSDIIIKIREIGLNYYGNCLGENEIKNDITGINIWESSIILSKWISDLLYDKKIIFNDKNVLEVGAGCGLPSLSLFIYSNIVHKNKNYGDLPNLVISDINLFTLHNISHNVNINKHLLSHANSQWENKIKICNIDWTNENTYLKDKNNLITYDFIIGSDLIYDKNVVPSLIHLLNSTLKKDGIFFYVCKKSRDGVQLFFELLKNNNFDIQFFTPPLPYFTNPFVNLDQNLFETKFSELEEAHNFVMLRCCRPHTPSSPLDLYNSFPFGNTLFKPRLLRTISTAVQRCSCFRKRSGYFHPRSMYHLASSRRRHFIPFRSMHCSEVNLAVVTAAEGAL
ncbi:methyltransferase, putative [Plasmodium ovale curtisi]|uniref:Methyltransferase, putative n=1 Tax=Plasmodium ovale curtisi TaxID=864141 RepID=A0A1A8WGI2_PLAOA|nr:methyltransferase, putative [Plasmodium ovale curtisi]